MIEKWKSITRDKDYKISNLGRAYRVRNRKSTCIGIAKLYPSNYGYLHFSMKDKSGFVHQEVARAFIGPCPKGLQVNHKDGVKTNNRVDNLEYVTPHENNQHALKLGLYNPYGESNVNSKLTEFKVNRIRKLLQHETPAKLARDFKVSHKLIRNIRDRKTWKHI